MVAAGLLLVASAVALLLTALRQNIVYFYGPAEMAAAKIEPQRRVRLGGLVAQGSLVREADNLVRFEVTDGGAANVPVLYHGLLPDLFREGQGVVAEGRLGTNGVFAADNVLAKHDERYMPPEVEKMLKKRGVWRGESVSRGQENKVP